MKYYFKGPFSNKEKNEILLPRNLCVGHNKNIWKENFYFFFYIKRISCWGQGIHNYTIFKRFLFLFYYRKRDFFFFFSAIDPSPILVPDWHTSDLAFYKWIELVSQFHCHFCQHLFSCPISPSSQTAHNYLKPRITHFIFSFLT